MHKKNNVFVTLYQLHRPIFTDGVVQVKTPSGN